MLAAGCRAPEGAREEPRAAVQPDVAPDAAPGVDPNAETDTTGAGAQPAGPPLVVDVGDEEALGPFASWTNVKTFGAKGDGATDDTAALQKALNSLCVYKKTGGPGEPTCNRDLYFPAGTYLITGTLSMTLNYGAGLIGEDPATTTIKWGGAANGIMLRTTSSTDTLFTRLTWDGSGTAGIGVAQWYDTAIMPRNYQKGIKHVDEVFEDLAFGIYGGRMGTNFGSGDSEVTIRRTKFLRASSAGVNVGSYNALDYWIWDSQFTDCAIGVTNQYSLTGDWYATDGGATLGAGNFMVYRSLFQRSKTADVWIGNTEWFSLHNNVSVDSKQFLYALPAYDNSAGIVVESNRIIDTINPTAIQIGNTGPLVLIDNQIRTAESDAGATQPVVLLDDTNDAYDRNVFSLRNRFTSSPTIRVNDPTGSANRAIAIGDAVVASSQISGALPALPQTAVNHSREVFVVRAAATTADIQSAIDAAVAADAAGGAGSNPVVHIPGGTYYLMAPLVIPAQARIQLTGDGLDATVLQWGVAGSDGPMIVLNGPSYATVRDLTLTAQPQATGISINNADQAGGRIFADGVDFEDGVTLWGLSQTRVEFQNSGLFGITASASMSVISVGGTLGQGVIDVVNGSNVLLSDHWLEGITSHLFRGTSGNFTYVGGVISPYSAGIEAGQSPTSPSVLLDGFAGNVTFVIPAFDLRTGSATVANGVKMVNATSATSALFLGVGSNISADFFSGDAGAGSLGIVLTKETDDAGHSIDVPDQGNQTGNAFITSGLSQLRGVSWQRKPYVSTPGATDVRLLRVSINTAIGGQAVGLKVTQ